MPFVKGQSGNPSGRPKSTMADGRSVTDVARSFTEKALQALIDVIESDAAPHPAKVSAANSILDRGWGKPAQSVAISGDEDNPLRTVLRVELVPLDNSAN